MSTSKNKIWFVMETPLPEEVTYLKFLRACTGFAKENVKVIYLERKDTSEELCKAFVELHWEELSVDTPALVVCVGKSSNIFLPRECTAEDFYYTYKKCTNKQFSVFGYFIPGCSEVTETAAVNLLSLRNFCSNLETLSEVEGLCNRT